jgi:hypothetical protein
MPPIIPRPATPFEIWVAKWIFLPIVLVGVVWSSVLMSIDRHRCVKACEVSGYKFADYTPRGRYGAHSVCTCSKDGVAFELPIK